MAQTISPGPVPSTVNMRSRWFPNESSQELNLEGSDSADRARRQRLKGVGKSHDLLRVCLVSEGCGLFSFAFDASLLWQQADAQKSMSCRQTHYYTVGEFGSKKAGSGDEPLRLLSAFG